MTQSAMRDRARLQPKQLGTRVPPTRPERRPRTRLTQASPDEAGLQHAELALVIRLCEDARDGDARAHEKHR